jgi:aerobic-type carbon monoxide dehydrogenase small subunit (CoxS/CutS family)
LPRTASLSILQKAFIEHFAFQCGYCTAGFLNESQVLLERLAKKPVARADLEKTIAEALDGHLWGPFRIRLISSRPFLGRWSDSAN